MVQAGKDLQPDSVGESNQGHLNNQDEAPLCLDLLSNVRLGRKCLTKDSLNSSYFQKFYSTDPGACTILYRPEAYPRVEHIQVDSV
jgi:hypothetical protein